MIVGYTVRDERDLRGIADYYHIRIDHVDSRDTDVVFIHVGKRDR